MRNRQVEFPPEQSHVPWLTPALLGFSALCIVVVIILLYTKERGAFIGPW
jgi:hypothetical protein